MKMKGNIMVENKSTFVKKFCTLIKNNTSEYSDIADIRYVNEAHEENIYVTYQNGAQRKICVNADSCSAIMDDFLNKVGHADWVLPSNTVEPTPDDGDFFEELHDTYSVEDFTGNIGVLLDDNADASDKESAMQFLEKLYLIATNYL